MKLIFVITVMSMSSCVLAQKSLDDLPFNLENKEMIHDEDLTKIINLDEVIKVSKYKHRINYTKDCDELYHLGHMKSGLYVIEPENTRYLVVFCLMDYDCSGWTVIQNNSHNGEITWTEAWTTYKYGFGNLEADHYLGNEYIYKITQQKVYKLRVVLNFDVPDNQQSRPKNETRYSEYAPFTLEDENDKYRIRLGAYRGDAGDALVQGTSAVHDNQQFSTKDKGINRSCARMRGGWWYDNSVSSAQCSHNALLNQKYIIKWATYCSSCLRSLMIIKPIHCPPYKNPIKI